MEGLSVGAVFAGYRIEGVLARGGMGVVYRATESRPARAVALKVVAPELAADEGFRARFLRESQIAASIEHPNVVPVLRVGEEDGMVFLAMRLIQGRNLGALIAAEGRLEPLRAARIIDQVADALDSAHELGLVHRDVKPANVLVESRRRGDQAYLTDFGLTKHSAGTKFTQTGLLVGTVNYMAPEQFEGKRVDARADVYSLGCVLFEALTGHAPYLREGEPAVMFAHLTEPPPTVSAVAPSLSPFDEIVRRALAKDPDERYPSAGDLGTACLAAAEGRPADRTERSVAIGAAAPEPGYPAAPTPVPTVAATPGYPHLPSGPPSIGRSRRYMLSALALVLVSIVVAVAVAVFGKSSGSRTPGVTLGGVTFASGPNHAELVKAYGTASAVPAGDLVYALARPSGVTPPRWYASTGSEPRNGGRWSAEIVIRPPSTAPVTVQAVEMASAGASRAPCPQPSTQCRSPGPGLTAQHVLSEEGPRAATGAVSRPSLVAPK
jgi:predicted Ser/Thr protein kinase